MPHRDSRCQVRPEGRKERGRADPDTGQTNQWPGAPGVSGSVAGQWPGSRIEWVGAGAGRRGEDGSRSALVLRASAGRCRCLVHAHAYGGANRQPPRTPSSTSPQHAPVGRTNCGLAPLGLPNSSRQGCFAQGTQAPGPGPREANGTVPPCYYNTPPPPPQDLPVPAVFRKPILMPSLALQRWVAFSRPSFARHGYNALEQ